jgi:flagellar hook protein FlgE
MLTSLFTAVSGMSANGAALDVIGDNIANQNTIGFKQSSVTFGDVLSSTISGNSQVGRGVMLTSVKPQFTQGSFQSTANVLDMAIEGDGMFMVNQGTSRYYTRAGQFMLDRTGNIVNPDGLSLQGYLADAAGNITGTVGDLTVAATQSPANATTLTNLSVNLDASAPVSAAWAYVGGTTALPPQAQFASSTTATVYDSLGGPHQVTAFFNKTGVNAWTAHYVYTDAAGNYQNAGAQNIAFNTSGAMTADNDAVIPFVWGGGAANGAITFDFGTSIAEGGTGLDATTQYSAPFSVLNLNQDGYSAGSLKNVSISQNGTITGLFTNGQSRSVGQLALARFVSATNMSKLGRNLYGESFDSGAPIVGAPDTSGVGKVLSNSLELSNVDLAEQFVKMISSQRGFEANSKSISTADELLQVLVNLKR